MNTAFEKLFWKLATVAIVATAASLWTMNERLARLESKVELALKQTNQTNLTKNQ